MKTKQLETLTKHISYKYVVFFLLLTFFAGNVNAWSNNTFNNSLTSEYISFASAGSVTRGLLVPENVFLTHAFFNLTYPIGSTAGDSLYYFSLDNTVNGTRGVNLTQVGGNFIDGKYGLAWNQTMVSYLNDTTKVIKTVVNGSSNFTVSFWHKKIGGYNSTGSCLGLLAGVANLGAGNGFLKFFGGADCNNANYSMQYGTDGGSYSFIKSNVTSNDSQFHRVVFTWNANKNNGTLYVDGILRGSANLSAGLAAYASGVTFKIGDDLTGSYAEKESIFDNLKIWNRTLTTAEIDTDASGDLMYLLLNNTLLTNFSVSNNTYSTNLTTKTDNFYSYFNNYLSSCSFVNGYCNLPIIFNSSIGGIFLEYSNLTFNNYGYIENSQTYNSSTFETASETFGINISYDANEYTSSSANLIYNGTSYAGTSSGSGNERIFTKTIDIPSSGTKNFYWQIGLTNSSGINYFNSTNYTQTANSIILVLCNTTTNVTYLNFTFKDETTGTTLNASNDLMDIDYWLGSGTITKNYLATNTSLFYSYPYCFSPPWRTVTADVSFKYSKSGYPQRTFFYDDQAFTNTTTNKVLYLLGSSDGIYSSIQVVSPSGVPIEGVTVTVEREIGGIFTIMEQGITDSAGSVTFWVNPNYDHRITGVKTGYVTEQVTIRPSQSLYTLRMSQTSGGAEYSSEIEGLYWHFLPGSGRISRGSHNFNATVYTYNSNLEGCKIEIVNQSNDAILDTQTTAATNTSYCYVNLDYTIVSGDRLFGRLAVDTTNSSGYVYVDTDWRWIAMDLNASSWTTVTSFFEEFKDLSEFGDGNEAEYSRFMFFFIAATILIGVFMFFSGVEFSSPGVTLFLLWALVFLASMGGFFTVDMGGDALDSHFEKFGLFYTMSLFIFGFAINQVKRYGE